jgi:hypothetical protein
MMIFILISIPAKDITNFPLGGAATPPKNPGDNLTGF